MLTRSDTSSFEGTSMEFHNMVRGASLFGDGSLGPHETQDYSFDASDLEIPRPPRQRWNDLDIDSVIFGCTNITFDECLNRKLFGLPRSHFSYVKLVKPGMPIFLYNYVSKKLCGVFEAVSYGEQYIDPFAWTGHSRTFQGTTRYPAQARVKLREDFEKVISLDEGDFRPLITQNYYTSRRFYFDLNSSQTSHLVKKFEISRDCLRLIADALAASPCSSDARGWKTTSTQEYMKAVRGTRDVLSLDVGSEQEGPLSDVTCHQRRYSGNSFSSLPVTYSRDPPANVPTAGPVLATMQEVHEVTYKLNSDYDTVELEKSDPAERRMNESRNPEKYSTLLQGTSAR